MLAPGDPVTKAFGTRRSPDRGEARILPRAAPDRDGPGRSAGPLGWALRISAAVGLVAVFAAHHLARLSHSDVPGAGTTARTGQVAMADRAPLAEPETTGSITPAGAARAIRLDPCLLPALDRPRP